MCITRLLNKFIKTTFIFKIYKKMKVHKHCINKFLSASDIVFDIGAHIGDKSKFFIKRGIKVIMVEPLPLCLEELHKRYSNNSQVIIVAKGVSNKIGSAKLRLNNKNPVLSTFESYWTTGRFKDEKWEKILKVKTTTLDALILKYGDPKYIKIDVEGHELQVLKGLTKKSGIISFEFVEEFFDQALKCINYLQSIGYKEFNLSLGDNNNFYSEWKKKNLLLKQLKNFIKNKLINKEKIWGDIYCR